MIRLKVNRLAVLTLLVLVTTSFSQKMSRFEAYPEERQALVLRFSERASADRQEARIWAKAHGKPMRFDDGRQLSELVAIRNGKPVYLKTYNVNAAISTGTDKVRDTTPYNLEGAGVTVGVWDGGEVLTTHQEFGNRVIDRNGEESHYHATHVGGTIGASGVSSSAKGMAPAVLIDSYDWINDLGEMVNAAASAPGQVGKLYLSNHSYGSYVGWEGNEFFGFEEFGQYSSESQQTDEVVYNSEFYLPFWAAGNDRGDTGDGSSDGDHEYKAGYDTISNNGISKNVITVGAVNDAVSGSIRSLSNAGMTTFSSWGPADDGRIKPDIVANGYGLYSCDNDSNDDYLTLSGTSMSSPTACGSAALLVDYYDDRFPGDAMRASTLKGLIIHTADDLGRPGPDYVYGWGLMNTLAAADLIRDYADGNVLRLTEDNLSNSSKSKTFSLFSPGVEALRITLCWTDPAGASTTVNDSRTSRLVNKLDLIVTGPDGTHYPYKLDYNYPENNATANGPNSVDNVEQVYIADPQVGQYTVSVNISGVVSGTQQWYSLLVNGITSDSDQDQLPDYWESLYFSSATGALASVDSDSDGADNLTEYISGHDPTNPASVFAVSSFSAPASGNTPFIVNWDSVEGRVYSVEWTPNLVYISFDSASGELPYPANSYTDHVDHATQQIYYRVGVKLVE